MKNLFIKSTCTGKINEQHAMVDLLCYGYIKHWKSYWNICHLLCEVEIDTAISTANSNSNRNQMKIQENYTQIPLIDCIIYLHTSYIYIYIYTYCYIFIYVILLGPLLNYAKNSYNMLSSQTQKGNSFQLIAHNR